MNHRGNIYDIDDNERIRCTHTPYRLTHNGVATDARAGIGQPDADGKRIGGNGHYVMRLVAARHVTVWPNRCFPGTVVMSSSAFATCWIFTQLN